MQTLPFTYSLHNEYDNSKGLVITSTTSGGERASKATE